MKARREFTEGVKGDVEYKAYLIIYFTGLNVAALLSNGTMSKECRLILENITASVEIAKETVKQFE